MDKYASTEQWLYHKLPMFQRIGSAAYKANLDNITKLCDHLGNPQNSLKTIHVAGTNGKGSTSHMMASVLFESGYKVGLHTSPHLKYFGERSRVNGVNMPNNFVVEFVSKHRDFIENLGASYFEVAVAMGFTWFSEQNVDIAVIETGLGGRLDSTNIITPEISIITNVGLDHTAILGDSIDKIAAEKAGIIKEKVPIVVGEYSEETKNVFRVKADNVNAPIYFIEDLDLPDYLCDLKGIYQNKNIKTATCALLILRDLQWNITDQNIQKGLLNVVKNTNLRGRWDVLQESPYVVADTGHNEHAIKYIVKQISDYDYNQLHLVLGFVNDKDVHSILQYFPKDAQYYFCSPDIPRRLEIEDLKQMIPNSLNANYFESVDLALEQAKNNATPEDFIFVGGSTFVVAEII